MPVVPLCPALHPLFQGSHVSLCEAIWFWGSGFFLGWEGVRGILYSGLFCKVKACFSGVTLLTS